MSTLSGLGEVELAHRLWALSTEYRQEAIREKWIAHGHGPEGPKPKAD